MFYLGWGAAGIGTSFVLLFLLYIICRSCGFTVLLKRCCCGFDQAAKYGVNVWHTDVESVSRVHDIERGSQCSQEDIAFPVPLPRQTKGHSTPDLSPVQQPSVPQWLDAAKLQGEQILRMAYMRENNETWDPTAQSFSPSSGRLHSDTMDVLVNYVPNRGVIRDTFPFLTTESINGPTIHRYVNRVPFPPVPLPRLNKTSICNVSVQQHPSVPLRLNSARLQGEQIISRAYVTDGDVSICPRPTFTEKKCVSCTIASTDVSSISLITGDRTSKQGTVEPCSNNLRPPRQSLCTQLPTAIVVHRVKDLSSCDGRLYQSELNKDGAPGIKEFPAVVKISKKKPRRKRRCKASQGKHPVDIQGIIQSISATNCDLVIAVDATPTCFGGYMVNQDDRRILYYSIPFHRIPWNLRDRSKRGNAEEFEMKNLLTALLLWSSTIVSQKRVRIYTDNFAIVKRHSEYGGRVRDFIKHMANCEDVIIVNLNNMALGSKRKAVEFEKYIGPADHLSRRRLEDFKVAIWQSFIGQGANNHKEWKFWEERKLNGLSTGVDKWSSEHCSGCGFQICHTGSFKTHFKGHANHDRGRSQRRSNRNFNNANSHNDF